MAATCQSALGGTDPQQESDAAMPHIRICGAGDQPWSFLLRLPGGGRNCGGTRLCSGAGGRRPLRHSSAECGCACGRQRRLRRRDERSNCASHTPSLERLGSKSGGIRVRDRSRGREHVTAESRRRASEKGRRGETPTARITRSRPGSCDLASSVIARFVREGSVGAWDARLNDRIRGDGWPSTYLFINARFCRNLTLALRLVGGER